MLRVLTRVLAVQMGKEGHISERCYAERICKQQRASLDVSPGEAPTGVAAQVILWRGSEE